MTRRTRLAVVLYGTWILGAASSVVIHAHSGPPYPIVSDRVVGPYKISIWTDPDTTDDGSAAGQFWVMVQPAAGSVVLPAATRAAVSISAGDGRGRTETRQAEPVRGDVTRQFVALVMDHEGRFLVRVSIDGPLGEAEVGADVDATYDLRPARAMVFLYLMPFLLVGFLWGKQLLYRRRRGITGAPPIR